VFLNKILLHLKTGKYITSLNDEELVSEIEVIELIEEGNREY